MAYSWYRNASEAAVLGKYLRIESEIVEVLFGGKHQGIARNVLIAFY